MSQTTADAVRAAQPDVFRKKYRTLNEAEKYQLERIKDQATVLYESITAIATASGTERHKALAKTALEECVMWAIKAASA